MPKYVIERPLPGAGNLTGVELEEIASKSNAVLAGMGGRAQWLTTFVTDEKLFCVYIAEDEQAVREHATAGGFPCTEVHRVRSNMDPTTGGL